jgi:hypothetical protein
VRSPAARSPVLNCASSVTVRRGICHRRSIHGCVVASVTRSIHGCVVASVTRRSMFVQCVIPNRPPPSDQLIVSPRSSAGGGSRGNRFAPPAAKWQRELSIRRRQFDQASVLLSHLTRTRANRRRMCCRWFRCH